MEERELYFCTDIEADGPAPGVNSMLSFATAVYQADKTLVDTFSANLLALPGCKANPDTMRWWQDQDPKVWDACRKDPQDPKEALTDYVEWVESFVHAKPVFIAYPAGFDFSFMYYYMMRFVGRSPFSCAALDIKTYAAAMLKRDYYATTKQTLPKHWLDDLPHTHIALDDAIEHGATFCNMLMENLKSR